MPPVEEDKTKSIVLKKISVEKHAHIKERVSPKETVLDVHMVEPLELKTLLETADGILKSEGCEQEQVPLKHFMLPPEGEELEMTHLISRTPTPTGETREVAVGHIIYEKNEPLLVDEKLQLICLSSEHEETVSREGKRDEAKLAVNEEGDIERVSDKSRLLEEREIPAHEKGGENESTYVPSLIPRGPFEPRDKKRFLRKERKPDISLQHEEPPIKDKISFVKSITEAEISDTPLLTSEEKRGEFTLEKSEVPPGESMKDRDMQKKAQQMKKSGPTIAEIPMYKILNKEAKKMEIIQDDEKDEKRDFISLDLHPLEFSDETTEPALKKDSDLEHPNEEKVVPRVKAHRDFEQCILNPRAVEIKTGEKYSAEEGEPIEVHCEEGLETLLTEKALLSDKKPGRGIISEKKDKTIFSTHSKKDKFRQSNAPEELPIGKQEFDTMIIGEGMESEVSIGEHEKGVGDEIANRSESAKKVLIQLPRIQDKKLFQKLHTTQDESEKAPDVKSSKIKTEEKEAPLTVEEVKLSGRVLQEIEGISDEKPAAENDIRKSTSVTKKKEKEMLPGKITSGKGIPASGEITYSSSIGKIITPKKVEGGKEYWKSEPAHVIEQASSLLSDDRNLDASGESHQVLDVPTKPHAKRGEEDYCQILPQSACTICFKRKYHLPLQCLLFNTVHISIHSYWHSATLYMFVLPVCTYLCAVYVCCLNITFL